MGLLMVPNRAASLAGLLVLLRKHEPPPHDMGELRLRIYQDNIRNPDPHPELQFDLDRNKKTRKTNPHPENLSPDAVVVVNPSGMQVKAVSKFVTNPQGGGATGRRIAGRSKKARGRLMRHLIQVDLSGVAAERKNAKFSKCLFLTLTYPDIFQDHEQGKSHIKALRKRLERKYGIVWAVWIQEFQERGAFHYHVMLLLPKVAKVAVFRAWLAWAWYEIVGSENEKHLRAGTGAEPVYIANGDPGSLLSYLSKELGGFGKKYQLVFADQETGELVRTGKTWGIWGRDAFNAAKVTVCSLKIKGVEAWQRFKENVSSYFAPSRYLRKVSSMSWWGGGILYGDGLKLLEVLLDGVPDDSWGFVQGLA